MTIYRLNIATIVTRRIILLGLMILLCLNTRAEIWIGGNVYGGGDQGKVNGNTTVVVLSGNLGTDNLDNPGGNVFGGARMADVGGNAYVHIDGEHATNYIVANRVYGGNDIAGTIEGNSTRLPDEVAGNENGVDGSWNTIVHLSTKTTTQGEGNAAVIVPATDAKSVYIGQLFGGGNGDYSYTHETIQGVTTYYIKDSENKTLAENKTGFTKPDTKKTYVDIHGGSIVYAFAGGNNATVTEKAVIHVDNPSEVVNHIYDTKMTTQPDGELLTTKRFKAMGINTGFSKPSSDEFQIGRLFGGNNKKEMSIRPTWSLESGKVRNVYSGGNEGPMTHTEGLLLEIKESSTIVIDNLYGGCRMADVDPLISGTIEGKDAVHAAPTDIQLSDKDDQGMPLYRFPAGLAARVLVRGGDINNVYGGNDVRGRVYGGNAIGIYTSIRGDVYGGGNGSYPYTDNADLIGNDVFGDFYYNPVDVLNANYTTEQISTLDQDLKSVTALNAIRPDAEQVSIRLVGKADKNTIIGGSVYVGGNSATIVTDKENPKVELKIGSYVIADKVFLGNNGENMIDQDYLKLYAGYVDPTTDELTNENTQGAAKFSTIDLTDKDAFAAYMDGAAMSLIPSLVFDDKNNGDPDDYLNYSTKIGSFYCGGNVGSMTYAGTNTMNFNRSVIIYNKLVGGCNNANIDASPYNAYYEGGVLGSKNERSYYKDNESNKIKDRLVMNFFETKIMPMRWNDTFTEVTTGTLTAGKTYYTSDLRSSAFIATGNEIPYAPNNENAKTHYYQLTTPGTELVWNTARWDDEGTDDRFIAAGTTVKDGESYKEEDRRLLDGNVYGGCYESGHVNGNVVINLNNDLFDRKDIFAQTTEDEEGNVTITGTRNSGVIYDEQTNDVNAVAMTVFGGGYGKETEIWGGTTVNLNRGYTLQIFGGGYAGVVGKRDEDSNGNPVKDDNGDLKYTFNADYSTTVRLNGATAIHSEEEYENKEHVAEAEFLYGAGNEGNVAGNSYVYLGNGLIYDVFGGASNADILGHTEVYIGGKANGNDATIYGFPWIKDIVYGGNDFGGKVKGEGNFTNQVTTFAKSKVYGYNSSSNTADVLNASAYVEYIQGRVDTIFGGSYGNYNYHDKEFYIDGHEIEMPYLHSAFVNIRPAANDYNKISAVFGGSTGFQGNRNGDKAQDHSYVLIDIPQEMDNFRYTEIYGAGSYSGMGMREAVLPKRENDEGYAQYLAKVEESSAVVDLVRGKVGAAYGGSYNEGVTRRTVVNVPAESTIDIGSIFGGAFGNVTLSPCDVYEANVNYHSDKAWLTCNPRRLSYNNVDSVGDRRLKGAIYGGNNNRRRTLYSKINIDVPVNQHNHVIYEKDGKILETKGYVYGAGLGENTWAEYTEVNLNDGAWVYEVYGGGENGLMINSQSIQKYINELASVQGLDITKAADLKQWQESWSIGGGLDGFKDENNDGIIDEFKDKATLSTSTFYTTNTYTNLNNPLVTPRKEFGNKTFNANVIINQGAYVGNYAYGGGLGSSNLPQSGDIYGTTYIALLGGEVKKDIYAAGTTGGVYDEFGVMAKSESNPNGFTASANAYIEGGTARNVYGGGWEGNVGKHTKFIQQDNNTIEITAGTTDDIQNDIPGETNVVIGIRPELVTTTTYYKGVPAIQRNAYAGGEGGSVIGNANITINNGYIGYVHLTSTQEQDSYGSIKTTTTTGLKDRYEAKLNDETNWEGDEWYGNKSLEDCGNVFGSGYDDMSSVDISNVTLYGGIIRNSVFGGGEIATVGRGKSGSSDDVVNIYKAGETHIYMYNGHVLRNVFGGGKGYNNLGYGGKNKLHTDGFVFGRTEVNIRGGEIGTANGVALGDGNVFGGGDRGYVYSAYEYTETQEATETQEEKTLVKVGRGKKDGKRYDNGSEGYYYKHNGSEYVIDNGKKVMTEDCKVLIEPWLQVIDEDGIDDGNTHYSQYDYVPTAYLNKLPKKNPRTNNTEAYWPAEWDAVDVGSTEGTGENLVHNERGVIIHNAVFAGGNISAGSTMNANTRTVYGNATASINDVYHRDFITIGTGHTGGLYGDGNLTLVDGYRELNITNYGTDYYNMSDDREISIETYKQLPPREQAYYEVRYKCIQECVDIENTHYKPASEGSTASTITFEEMLVLFLEFDQQQGKYVSLKQGNDDILTYKDGNWVPNTNYWKQNGVCSIYAGRIMNTIQRADFCGVFGSRMVMKGAQDRVPETVDYTNYTINRVREVSLNKKTSGSTTHGNYFGIYSIVNYLGSLTSDVDFGDASTNAATRGDKRVTDNEKYRSDIKIDGQDYTYDDPEYTYSNWKSIHYRDNSRNNGNSHNQVALASGVYLELTTEQSTGTELNEKDWGPITGVVELDLINVSLGIGGGFVYAKNEHGKRQPNTNQHPPLTSLNQGAVSKDNFKYVASEQEDHWEASGNFVHSTQTIIDDCYNVGGKYYGNNAVPAHYWFIKGQVYIYDQYISAYTGSPNAYSETVDIPLSISSASHSEMKLVDIQPNKYALYSSVSNGNKTKLAPEQKLIVNDVTYYLNDPISYWDWSLLSASEQALFVDETYVNCVDVKIDNDNNLYKAGTIVKTKDELATFKASNHQYKTESGEPLRDGDGNTATTDYVFRSSNNVSHGGGYILTYDVNNPGAWNKWYTPKVITENDPKISTATYNQNSTDKNKYIDGPTYRALQPGLYGRRLYKLGDIIPKSEFDTYSSAYNTLKTAIDATALAEYAKPEVFKPAYITTEYVEAEDVNGHIQHLQKGAKLAMTEYTNDNNWPAALDGKVKEAYICTSSIKMSDTEFIVANELLTLDDINQLISRVNTQITALPSITSADQTIESLTEEQKTALGKNGIKTLTTLISTKNDISTNIVPAYYCTSTSQDGIYYGGDYYNASTNYRAMDVWSSMSSADRDHFEFNYDALDILIDPIYGGITESEKKNNREHKYQYDGKNFNNETQAGTNLAAYSLNRSLDYTATFTGKYTDISGTSQSIESLVYKYKIGDGAEQTVTINKNNELDPTAFERIPNEQRNYTQFKADINVYIVNTAFMFGNTPYAIGQTISSDQYNKMGEFQNYITILNFDSVDKDKIFYYCRDGYVIGKYKDITYTSNEGKPVTAATRANNTRVSSNGDASISVGGTVPAGYVISQATYNTLTNKQLGFDITSVAPKEYSTFYVSRNSDINDLSKDKIITVIYRYDYEETTDEAGTNIAAVSERHVVNIHLQFKSGIPYIPDITAPGIVLPGEIVTLKEPNVTPGAYEIVSSGWELFEEPRYAENHTNGIDYTPHEDELYWYENGYYVAYYAKTYLGKHYSNHVPISVANYHDLKEVMDDKLHHLHVDHPGVKRDSKIYINDYSSSSQNGLDLFKDFYDLSLETQTYDQTTGMPNVITTEGNLNGHMPMNSHVKGGDNLEFILRTNIDHTGEWTPIGDASQCFKGNLHGDGYTISGLKNSLFGKLCGEVYNLGVTGSFSTSGVADSGNNGYVESCWINTDGELNGSVYAVFGTDENDLSRRQLVNSYYPENLNYKTQPINENDKRGIATPMSEQSFYNGEVTYNLNSFYLNKRYYDGKQLTSGTDYKYIDTNNKTEGYKYSVGHYPPLSDLSDYAEFSNLGYVEKRYADGDFRYAEGYIPSSADPRYIEYTVQVTENNQPVNAQKSEFVPLWPNDYLFFGQDLTYGYNIERPHQEIPSNYDIANRVMRAPAYFGSKEMSVVHFNADAYLTTKSSDGLHTIYPGMTAIDLAGHNDVTGDKADYKQGLSDGKFFAPLLDYTDLTSIVNRDETQNLLVYAPGNNHSATQSVLTTYFAEPIYVEDNTSYRRVEQAVTNTIHGHLVNYNLTANNDHLLVDKQDFNAPIGYEFVKKSNDHIGSRMWYQRVPGLYMETSNSGWETVSLPFTAELVTTQQKGEITHFYEGNTVGHEYWLRKLDQVESNKDPNDDTKTIYTGIFKSPESGSKTKTVSNTFLWDYYYSKNNQDDANGDDYQEYYKNINRDYNGYPYYAAGTPYLIGWPGSRYYEFDLSGQFVPKNTAADTPARLDPQVITFASETGISIDVTDDEYLNAASKVTYDGYAYTFVPTYQTKALTDDYLMNATGNKFEQQATATTVPFRPYITVAASSNGAQRRMGTRASELLIGYNGESNQLDETAANRSLFIYSENMSICIESTLDYPADVTIYNVAGKLLKRFTIQPATKVTVPVNSRGVYIVNHRKIAVTR